MVVIIPWAMWTIRGVQLLCSNGQMVNICTYDLQLILCGWNRFIYRLTLCNLHAISYPYHPSKLIDSLFNGHLEAVYVIYPFSYNKFISVSQFLSQIPCFKYI